MGGCCNMPCCDVLGCALAHDASAQLEVVAFDVCLQLQDRELGAASRGCTAMKPDRLCLPSCYCLLPAVHVRSSTTLLRPACSGCHRQQPPPALWCHIQTLHHRLGTQQQHNNTQQVWRQRQHQQQEARGQVRPGRTQQQAGQGAAARVSAPGARQQQQQQQAAQGAA